MQKAKFDITAVREYRKKLGMNQSDFWSGIGVTQSAGSRYETGRGLPTPTALLLTLRETGKVTNADLAAAVKMTRMRKKKSGRH